MAWSFYATTTTNLRICSPLRKLAWTICRANATGSSSPRWTFRFLLPSQCARIASEAEIAIPVCSGAEGHPILLASRLIPAILDWPGEGGLRGAINALDAPVCHVPVRDAGILHDADTPQDYQALLEYHNKQLARTEIKVTLTRELPFFDEKMAMLLALIDETGSVRIACKRMQISYSTGWNMIRRLESQTKGEVLNRVQGGAGGGGSHLTANGRRLLEAYRQFVADIKDYAASRYDHYFGDDL